ncbi:MAG: hypothetical protein DMG65_08075 [Candidatus Angelobacter sp. Gp1-AA117]|nr:MAG: hypothetical protein DMG65_08075 [Candidatus Angelobacter sp. Gp1-AA117]
MTIFGFNTDIKFGDTVYHVQSEARRSEQVIQTLVFVKGQCIGKRTGSYAHKASQPDFGDQCVHELLKAQHKTVLEAINEGKLDSVLGKNGHVYEISETGPPANGAKPDADFTIEFQITFSGKIVSGAEVVSRAGRSTTSAILSRAQTDSLGNVKMRIPLTEEVRHESEITVEATHGDLYTRKRFKIKTAG